MTQQPPEGLEPCLSAEMTRVIMRLNMFAKCCQKPRADEDAWVGNYMNGKDGNIAVDLRRVISAFHLQDDTCSPSPALAEAVKLDDVGALAERLEAGAGPHSDRVERRRLLREAARYIRSLSSAATVQQVAAALQAENNRIAAEYGSGNCAADVAYERLARTALSNLRNLMGKEGGS